MNIGTPPRKTTGRRVVIKIKEDDVD